MGERSITGPELVQQSVETIEVIRERLKTAQSRQKNCVDRRRRPLEFQVGGPRFSQDLANEKIVSIWKERETKFKIYRSIGDGKLT